MLKFFSDLLYIKGILCFDEYDAIMESCTPTDLDNVFEGIMRGTFNNYRRGEVDGDYGEL